jgi:hypothetical protein
MTSQDPVPVPVPVPQPKVRSRIKVEPVPEGMLEQLLIENRRARDEADIAGERADDLKSQIKALLLDLLPAEQLPDAFDIPADAHGRFPAYSLTRQEGFRLDTEAMKNQAPELYVRFAKKQNPSWTFRESKQGPRRRG